MTCSSVNSKESASKNTVTNQESISIMSTPDLYDLTSKWVSKYSKLNPDVKIEMINTSLSSNEFGAGKNLSFISNKSRFALTDETNWSMVVGRDIIVPIMNAGNPFLKEIFKQGISQEQFANMFKSPEKQNWGDLLSNRQNAPVHIYLSNDESVKAGVEKFIQESKIQNDGITIGNADEVVAAIQKDLYAIGFCKVVNIIGQDNQSLIEKVRLLPIDRNGNGTIDHMEDIYSDLNLFMRGVWIGKYPKTLYNNIYVVSKVSPTNENGLAFLKWVITDGQQLIISNGYCDLVKNEVQLQLDKINTPVTSVSPSKYVYSITGIVILTMAGLIAIGIIISAVFRRVRNKKTVISGTSISNSPGFDENIVVVPHGLYFDKSHTWAFMEKDGTVSVGIDDFLQHITGPVTRVEMKNPGEKIKRGDKLFSIIQSGKQLHIYAPVSGTIKKQNERLISESFCINTSPYSDGWVYEIEPANWFKEIQLLDLAEKYKRWLETEFSRLKDFLATSLRPESVEYSLVVLQDGGVLKDGVLADFGPEIWEDFQSNFLDSYK
jgi:glycine cleavage system H lipoate-binding protein/ABC-type phosphate transport system substrate-binding protein